MGQHSRLLPQATMLKPSNSSFMEKTRPLRNRLAEKIEWVKLRTPKVVKSRAFRRAATITSAVFFALSFIVILAKLTNAGFFIPKLVSHISRYPTCQSKGINGTRDIWEASQKKYENLMDDKFTIAMQTYRRPKELQETLNIILSEEVPSLLEIVVVWNDLENYPPDDYVSKYGVPVRFRKSKRNSLNEKLWPDPDYKTQAILLSDDDVYYHPNDLEFVFQTWRKFGRNRMVGALARCTPVNTFGYHKYTFCSSRRGEDEYNMVLTNLAFSHVSFLDYYSSNDTIMTQIREYVDEGFNCEDLAMNYVHGLLTGEGPLLINGHEKYVNFVPKVGISMKKGHMEARSACLNDFSEMFGCHPLVDESGYIQRGVLVM
ncbi:hypothetical protein FOYG_12175 [Fusarium oxysporum NRRL 32931]|uniref:Glycosyl transferase 64 domain-containing protein n=1 Tax=Fusarium oxysporum NRRL 32931 TaxID=660029 RepID=W9HR53_FUSOX|nr:hypothetical protein FOYG_12175 [Fusarium oxysporum NRRL 32931]KAJ0152178.1 Uncharacterized protein HZ326_5384 [Fusarium oxysporum f. sp. albedinis]